MNAAHAAQHLAWFRKNEAAFTAFAKGEQVQIKYSSEAIRPTGHNDEWNDTPEVFLNFAYEYRIKPAPRILYVVEYKRRTEKEWQPWLKTYDQKLAENSLRTFVTSFDAEKRITKFVENES